MFFRSYSLHKSYQILVMANSIYQEKKGILPASTRETMESSLDALQEAILRQDRKSADKYAKELEELTAPYFHRPWWRYVWEIILTLIIALIVATLIRQVWFEAYKIPTGSMRPTFREEDCLTVTKTAFGINTPLSTSHLYFDPSLVLRTGVFTFTADDLDMTDTDTRYFWLFPAKKQLIKRCMGLPGDSLYFYGGQLYGINAQGEDITPLLNPDWMERLDHVPYMHFLGRTSQEPQKGQSKTQELIIRQMNLPIGKLVFSPHNLQGLIHTGNEWVPDDPYAAMQAHSQPVTYSDFFGMGNFAQCRLLTAQEAQRVSGKYSKASTLPLYYLELFHHPSLSYPLPHLNQGMDNFPHISLPGFTSLLPLEQSHVDKLRQGLYTVRFVVSRGKATAYTEEGSLIDQWSPTMQGVPDGTYEFYYGKAYQVGWGGHLTELDSSHPLSIFATEHIQELFNLGIDMHKFFEIHEKKHYIPSRFAYFRDGAFYAMGTSLMTADDPLLKVFVAREKEREQQATKQQPYLGFLDREAPYRNGIIDADFIKAFGLTVPSQHYLALGDNYARSADSRVFGCVPEQNLKGAPSWIFFPPGPRWGPPLQAHYPFLNLPRFIIWVIALLCLLCWWLYTRLRMRRRIYNR